MEIGSLQTELVKMKSHWIRVGLKSKDWCGDLERRQPLRQPRAKEHRGLPAAPGSQEKSKMAPLLEPSEGAYHLDFGLLASRAGKAYVFAALNHLLSGSVSHGSLRT